MSTVIWTTECLICGYRPPTGLEVPQICTRCRGKLRVNLADIPVLYVQLGDELPPGSGGGPKISGTRTPPLPARLTPLSLRGKAAPGDSVHDDYGDQAGHVPIVGTLETWDRDIRETFGYNAATFRGSVEQSVTSIVGFLLKQLGKVCDEHPAADEFINGVRDLHRQCRAAIGDLPTTMRLGPCPTALDDGTRCGWPLNVDAYDDYVSCRKCRTHRERSEWLHLGLILRENRDGAA